MRISFFAMGAALMVYSNALNLTQDTALETNEFFDGFAQSDSMQDAKAAVVKSEPKPATKPKKPADIVA